jgi:hypothetical protein
MDYSRILVAVADVLMADAVLTGTSGLLASYAPAGVAASRANSIFYPGPPAERVFPCVTLADVAIGPGLPRQHDTPMALVKMSVRISVWGASQLLRPICAEIDAVLETAYRAGAMDTADWQFIDIDTSAAWQAQAVPDDMLSGSTPIEQRTKTFDVRAALKG